MPDLPVRSAALADGLERATEQLLTQVDALPADLIRWKPAPDVWSVMEILCHVAEFVPYWASQTMQIVSTPDHGAV